MVSSYYYSNNQYVPRTADDGYRGFIFASAASSAILGTIMPICASPFSKHLASEHTQNYFYKDALYDSLRISGLEERGVRILPMQNNSFVNDYVLGKNAAYSSMDKSVMINTDKISIAGFHELGHAMNDLMGKSGKILSKLRKPGIVIAGWLGTIALFSRPKPKDAPKNNFDHIKDNCGKLAFACWLPVVLEEAMASYKGVKLARKTGLAEPLIKNMKNLYKKALLTYIGRAVATGLAVGSASMIMDKYTRPRKIEQDEYFSLFT